MASQEIEIILSRQWSDYLSIPVFITDPDGNLLYFNEQAEEVLGKRFEDTQDMPLEEWASVFEPKDDEGNPMDPNQLPLVKTLTTKLPAMGAFHIDSLDGRSHSINVVSFPITGMSQGHLGAIAIFWINEDE